MSFERHRQIYQSDGPWGGQGDIARRWRSRERPWRPPPALIVLMSLRPGIPWRVALQQSPLPLPRLGPACDDTAKKASVLR